jgi:hypothetical protein
MTKTSTKADDTTLVRTPFLEVEHCLFFKEWNVVFKVS